MVTYEEVLQHLLHAHGEHLRTTTDPLSLGDFVTVNYVNPLYARATSRPEGAMGRAERFLHPASPEQGNTDVLLEGLPESYPCTCEDGGHRDGLRCLCGGDLPERRQS